MWPEQAHDQTTDPSDAARRAQTFVVAAATSIRHEPEETDR
jgi:hypothetical protein